MGDGSHQPISEIKVGDYVASADPETGELAPQLVVDLITGSGLKTLITITFDFDGDGRVDDSVVATDRHPFWIENANRWVDAEDLRRGDLVTGPTWSHAEVLQVRTSTAELRVHDLTVDGHHTYFVSQAGVADVLVHNASEGDVCRLTLGPGPHAREGVPLIGGHHGRSAASHQCDRRAARLPHVWGTNVWCQELGCRPCPSDATGPTRQPPDRLSPLPPMLPHAGR
jgi:hypothetical protein